MDLVCVERLASGQLSSNDPVIFKDSRVFYNLLNSESKYLPRIEYFSQVQNDLEPYMRKLVGSWMLEVCEEHSCEDNVFPLAINFLDRFLCECSILRNQLQLTAAACILLASKIKQCDPIPVELICFYAENSILPDQVRAYEILVVAKLNWEISGVTGFDFIDHILQRIPECKTTSLIRSHARTILALGYAEADFIGMKSSSLGAGALVAAARGLKVDPSFENHVSRLVHLEKESIDPIAIKLELLISAGANKLYTIDQKTPSETNFIQF